MLKKYVTQKKEENLTLYWISNRKGIACEVVVSSDVPFLVEDAVNEDLGVPSIVGYESRSRLFHIVTAPVEIQAPSVGERTASHPKFEA